jgi:hypothetical protein
MANGMRIMTAMAITNAGFPVQTSRGVTAWKKFIPKKPTTKDMGINRVVIMVNVFITSVVRLLTTER